MSARAACSEILVYGFRGDKTPQYGNRIQQLLDDARKGIGLGPTIEECLLLAGHTGLSLNSGKTIYGFNPFAGKTPLWQLMDDLANGLSYPGRVLDDTQVFQAAGNHGLIVQTFRIRIPQGVFVDFEAKIDDEINGSQYRYGFPNGDGDCNCVTWIERLGIPLLSGRMNEFLDLKGFTRYPSRRFGSCI